MDFGTITDFNFITDFGYRFINSPASNGPGTTSSPVNQYYTWKIGLGTSYNYDSFGAQFCLPRNTSNPISSVRYKESNAWGIWTGITATSLKGSCTIYASEWLRSSHTSSQRLVFCVRWNNILPGV